MIKLGRLTSQLKKDYGISTKDQGGFVSVNFGSDSLTPIGFALTGECNSPTKTEAFELAKQIQPILGRIGKIALRESYN